MKKFYRFYPMLFAIMILIITGSAGAYFSGDRKGIYGEDSQSGIEANDLLVKATSHLNDHEAVPEGFTKAEWGKIRASIERDVYRIHKDNQTGTYQAPNHTHDLDATFTREGFDVRPRKEGKLWNWGLRLSRYGYGEDLHSVPEIDKIITKDNRIEYHRGDMVEWYINDHRGLEQSFTVNNKPSHPKGVPSSLILEFTLSGTLQPLLQGNTLLLSDSTGQTCIRYTGLYAFDNEGETLSSRLALKDGTLRILVDDSMASYPITIDPWLQKSKLTVWFGNTDDYFGYSVAIDGDTVVVGAPSDDFGGNTDQGSVYVFEKSGDSWTRTGELIPNDGAGYANFGHSVSVNGNKVVVGAYADDIGGNIDQGSAYVFEKSGGTWYQTAKLTASDGVAYDSFGHSVSIDGYHVVVGASHYDDDDGPLPGSAYIFSYMYFPINPPVYFWMQTAKLTASDGFARNAFGNSVSISGDTVVVGAVYDDDKGSSSGSAYVFEKPGGGWTNMTQTAKLIASDGANGDFFGNSVSINGSTMVIGASGDDIGANSGQGSAYIFEKPDGGWVNMTQMAKLIASDGAPYDFLGTSVSISGSKVVVGPLQDAIGGNISQGSAYIFEKPSGGWANMTQTAKLTASDGAAWDGLGRSVSISGDMVVVGAPRNDGNGTRSGSAYIFLKTVYNGVFFPIKSKSGNTVIIYLE